MPGEKDLTQLLRRLQPKRQAGTYVFVTRPLEEQWPSIELIATFREAEGMTMLLREEDAQKLGWTYDFRAAWITLQVHSALEAVGLTAAVAAALTEVGISCNVWAAYYHDHIFVAEEQAEAALQQLNKLAISS